MTLLKTLKLWVVTALLLCALPVDARREATPLLSIANETSLTLSTYSLDLYLNAYGQVQVESGSGSYEIINMNPAIVEISFISDGVANAKAQTPGEEGSRIDDLLSVKGIALGDAIVKVKDKNTQEVAEVKVHVGTAPHLSLSSYSQTLTVGERVEVEVLTGSRMYQVNSSNSDIVKAVSFTRSSGRIGPNGEPIYETHEMIEISAKTIGNAVVSVKDLSSNETAEITVTVKANAPASPIISFADPEVERICVAQWDTDGDGQLSQAEAAAVRSVANVFQGNSSITSFDELRFFTGLTAIDDFAFYNCASLTSVKFPTGVTEIGESAFGEDANLKEAQLPSGVRTVRKMAFFHCRNLAKVTLPNGLTTIGASAFFYCDNLKSVTIPATVTSIGEGAFAMLATSPDVYCRATLPPTAAADAFNYSTARGTLHVPMGCADSYRNVEGWKAFENIVEMEGDVWCPTIIVTTHDGAMVEYLIDRNTKVKIEKPNLIIETDGMVLIYELENMSQVRYGRMLAPMGIPVINVTDSNPFKMENETLFLSGLAENTLVSIYNAEGKTVMSRRYSGNAQVSLKSLTSGVYFVKFNHETYKILKK